jgi:hypothetical protein
VFKPHRFEFVNFQTWLMTAYSCSPSLILLNRRPSVSLPAVRFVKMSIVFSVLCHENRYEVDSKQSFLGGKALYRYKMLLCPKSNLPLKLCIHNICILRSRVFNTEPRKVLKKSYINLNSISRHIRKNVVIFLE